jgi:hypothetical protein
MSYISMAGLCAALDVLLELDPDECESHSRSLADGLIESTATHGCVISTCVVMWHVSCYT